MLRTARSCRGARRGAKFYYDAAVEDIIPSGDGYRVRWLPVTRDDGGAAVEDWQPVHVDGVVICAGTASRRFAAALGDRINIYPVKGYSITVQLYTPESQQAAHLAPAGSPRQISRSAAPCQPTYCTIRPNCSDQK